MTTVFRRKDSGSLTYYCKINGKRIALHENKATAQQLALAHAAKAHREKHGIEAPPAAEKEPRALQVIAEYLRTRDRFAPNSIKIIDTNKLALFGDGLHRKGYFGNVKLSSITEGQIHALVAHSFKTLKYATVRQRIKYLRFFGKWAVELGYIRQDQAPGKLGSKRYLPKELKREIQVPTREEFDAVFAKLHPRFKPYVLTLLNTGCRRMELASARVSWIEERNGKLWLKIPAEFTKTRSARTTPILPEAQPYVRKAMEGKQPGDYLFESKPELLAMKASQCFHYWVVKLGIKNKFVLHTLRAMFICNLNVKGIPISQIARWAGQTVQQCFEYCKINTADSESLLEKAGF
jgi:integrase